MATATYAVYASNNKGLDVTSIVNDLLANGNDDITVNNATFGTDPDPGSTKYFFVWYTSPGLNKGDPVGLACVEDSSVDLIPVGPPPDQYATSPQPPLIQSGISAIAVTKAVWGTTVNGLDVTAACQAIVNQGAVGLGGFYIPLGNNTFGADPDVGATKYFAMQYSVGGSGPFFIGGKEGQTIALQSGASDPSIIIATPANVVPAG